MYLSVLAGCWLLSVTFRLSQLYTSTVCGCGKQAVTQTKPAQARAVTTALTLIQSQNYSFPMVAAAGAIFIYTVL